MQIYGAGGDVAVRMVYFYLEQKLWNGRADIVAGRYTLGADFGASPLNCIFMALTICGNPRIMPLQRGFSSWPLTDWGARIRVHPTETTYVMTGLFESSTGSGGPSGFHWSLNDATGAVVPLELGYEPSFGSNALTGHYEIGGFYDTSKYPDYYYDVNGDPALLSGLPYKIHNGRGTVYFLFDQMLMRNGPGLTNGLNLVAGFLDSNTATSPYRTEAYVGFVDESFRHVRGMPWGSTTPTSSRAKTTPTRRGWKISSPEHPSTPPMCQNIRWSSRSRTTSTSMVSISHRTFNTLSVRTDPRGSRMPRFSALTRILYSSASALANRKARKQE
jgi:porin